MNKLYVAGIDEIPQHITQEDNDLLRITIICPPGYSGEIKFGIDLLRPGVKLDLAGAYFCSGCEKQKFDITVRHLVGGATSHQMFKGIVGENGSSVFNGLIHVARDARKTKAVQENHSLLLGTNARAESHPQLEIYADDVECSHGATIGYLNPDEMFYMRSRGIPENEARRLQVLSFLEPVLSRVPEEVRQRMILNRLLTLK